MAEAPVASNTVGWVPTAGGSPVYSTASSRSWQRPPPGTVLVCIIQSCTHRPGRECLVGKGASSPRVSLLLETSHLIMTRLTLMSTHGALPRSQPGTETSTCSDFSHGHCSRTSRLRGDRFSHFPDVDAEIPRGGGSFLKPDS